MVSEKEEFHNQALDYVSKFTKMRKETIEALYHQTNNSAVTGFVQEREAVLTLEVALRTLMTAVLPIRARCFREICDAEAVISEIRRL